MNNKLFLLVLMTCGYATAQTFTTLYNFTGGSDGTLSIGLILSGNTIYGTAGSGGSSTNGTVFKVNTDGTAFTVLHSFTAGPCSLYRIYVTNGDGANINGGLILSGGTLYGTTQTVILYGNASDGSIYGIYRSTDGGLTFSEQNGSNLSSLMFDGREG
jgi:uncharacterized repeat protein (TIGR03803 family)